MGNKIKRRPLKYATLEESLKEIHCLNELGYTKEKNWDLAQILQHLNKTMKMSFEGADFGMPFFVQPIMRLIFIRFIVRKGIQLNAPAKAPPQLTPVENSDVEKEIQEYETWVKKLYDNESEIIPKHPIVGKISPVDWRAFHAWHAAHHLSFLQPKGAVSAEKQGV